MALPTDPERMSPLLRHIADGTQYSYTEVVPLLRRDFRLSDSDLSVNKEGGHPGLVNRTQWAKECLQEAGLPIGLRRFAMTQQTIDIYLQRSKEKRR